jgi:hypothetical protein
LKARFSIRLEVAIGPEVAAKVRVIYITKFARLRSAKKIYWAAAGSVANSDIIQAQVHKAIGG